MTTRVVHIFDEEWDIYIGRPSVWGNPFIVGKDGSRAEVVEMYRRYINNKPELLSRIGELEGKVLGCWCKPKPCHGDVLVELIEKRGEVLNF